MNYIGMELIWLLLVYSFFGWVIETIVGTIKKKQFVNRGFSSGPFCLIYGIAAVMMTVTMQELIGHPFFLFLGCAVLATAIEWFAGKLLERLKQHKWWDYSKKKWNFDGYICLPYSVLWGVLGALAVRFANRWIMLAYECIPDVFRTVFIIVVLILIILDLSVSTTAVLHIRSQMPAAARQWNHRLAMWTKRFSEWIIGRVEKRMEKAYPAIFDGVEQIRKQGNFAEGCGFYKLFWLFLIGSVLGDFTETIFCRITSGRWMSRSSLVWGPFSIVWGLAIVFATVLLYKDREKPDRHIFIAGMFLGGTYEYVCSVFTEIVFGKVFWDYSEIPFNLGGRINLLYCFFWGIAAVVWIKLLYPRFSGWIEKIPVLWGYILTWILILFLTVNVAVSAMALMRCGERAEGIPAKHAWERVMDEYFNDKKLEKIYPNAIEK